MNLLEYLEIYIQGQRNVGKAAIIFGTIFLLAALLLQLFAKSDLSTGMKTGSIVIGVLLYTMGIGLTVHQNKLLHDKQMMYQKNEVKFHQSETERMTKVKNDYPKNQWIMSILVCISLTLFLVIKNDYWQGVSLIIAVFMLGNIIIEAYSNISISQYYKLLVQ